MYNKPLTAEDYFNDPLVVEPFRTLDAVPVSDGGRAVIITTTKRAKDLKHPPVMIRGR